MYFPIWLRAMATISILLCHITGYGGVLYGTIMAQFLNIGVQIFFILSGFLFGVQKLSGGGNYWKYWYIKRAKRIYTPYWLFLIILCVVSILRGITIEPLKWLVSLSGFQGFDTVEGAGQTWYITAQLFCYLATPAISCLSFRLRNHGQRIIIVMTLLLLPLLLAVISNEYIWVFITPIAWYALAFIVGTHWHEIELKLSKRYLVPSIVVMLVMFGIRVVGKCFCDGTVLYNRIIVGYEHNISALCITLCFMIALNEIKPPRVIQTINNNSFEIYLYHFMFIGGPLSVIGITGNKMIDILLVILLTFVVSGAANRVINKIERK